METRSSFHWRTNNMKPLAPVHFLSSRCFSARPAGECLARSDGSTLRLLKFQGASESNCFEHCESLPAVLAT